ncbi:MAG: hypothetical protein HOB51_00760 [Thaumarchaeota archaeon]|jgi:hypothetical protein|nr:hypothetical protein [Nitrososphaerota archaeon]
MSKRLHLTPRQKTELIDIILARDGHYRCFYCHKRFANVSECWLEHLNDDRTDNRPDNIVFSCKSCNVKKQHDKSMRVQAREKLRVNELSKYVRDWKELQKFQVQSSEAVVINTTNCEITEQWLEDKLQGAIRFVTLKEALDAITFECKDKTGHGSQQSIRNYIDMLTSSAPKAPFEKRKLDGKWYIRRKQNPY